MGLSKRDRQRQREEDREKVKVVEYTEKYLETEWIISIEFDNLIVMISDSQHCNEWHQLLGNILITTFFS